MGSDGSLPRGVEASSRGLWSRGVHLPPADRREGYRRLTVSRRLTRILSAGHGGGSRGSSRSIPPADPPLRPCNPIVAKEFLRKQGVVLAPLSSRSRWKKLLSPSRTPARISREASLLSREIFTPTPSLSSSVAIAS